jgi:hypothetical protein
MLKVLKKAKIVDLLTMIRRKVKYTANDLIFFKVKYNRKCCQYEFSRVDQSNLNTDVFSK